MQDSTTWLIKWILIIILMIITISYFNQEVPACLDNPIQNTTAIKTNYTSPEINQVQEQLNENVLVFETSGDSMFPVIKDQQKCVCMKSDSYVVGDIVVFFANAGEGFEGIAHKIINIDGENITTQGVNNPVVDNPIKQENILCKIPTIKRYKIFGV